MCEEKEWISKIEWERMLWDVGGERGKKRVFGNIEEILKVLKLFGVMVT